MNTVIDNDLKEIIIDGYVFIKTSFEIFEKDLPSPFLQYDSHTVSELLNKKHYKSLELYIKETYPNFWDKNINIFMEYLVKNNDSFYEKFLNKNGNDRFCRFRIDDKSVYDKRGLYLYLYKNKINYIGRCRDNYYKRFNVNYGQIYPINCFKEGQSTNTYINSLMNNYGRDISIYLCPLTDKNEIVNIEESLIKKLQPLWNRKK